MELTDLKELFVEQLKDLYSAEKQISKALPKMAKKATSPKLAKAFELHQQETEGQIERLERIFEHLEVPARARKCKGMEGLLEESQEIMAEAQGETLDAGLIAAAQKVEHYEIASYGTLRTYARILGDNWSASLLQQTLDEEGRTDKKLSELAESEINLQAAEQQA
ncbi:MAG TPA: ferritin-like domain-containing protein [Phycisphaerae bacterium]|jgi:ferritin-like metal-binding protein YciE|nr:ferritin-like domain-containing protein [Phycisphaerae bacterium]HOB75569.1 ferritin-like domain-containing protein [Phycisphaerae bacterium]HOJ55161.1 ferritin-like domain-containing protein [Phycisphaerae bacterium]HOL27363.1 ferritin-like domain-containing protein [Phycisphaerae bacterium]HPP20697.1 ferritin-like domain-containing protein [Phycisphaerae bacterium]